MGFKNSLLEYKEKVYVFLTNPKLVRFCIKASSMIFISFLTLGYIIANLDGNMYSFLTQNISDLGSYNHTPVPKFLDNMMMLSAILLIPSIFYLRKITLGPTLKREDPKLLRILSNMTFICMIISMIGLWCFGFFNIDISKNLQLFNLVIFNLNDLFLDLVVSFLSITAILMGIILVTYPSDVLEKFRARISKKVFLIIGIEMIFLPSIFGTIFIITRTYFFDWLFLFFSLGWISPICYLELLHVNREIIRISLDRDVNGIKKKIVDFLNISKKFLTNPRLVKNGILATFIIFLPSILLGILLAQFDPAGPGLDLAGYNIVSDHISNLGSKFYSLIPTFLDNATMLTGIFLFPMGFYLKKRIDKTPEVSEEFENRIALRNYLTNIFLVCWVITMIGLFGIGFFSVDVSYYIELITGPVIIDFGWHDIFAFLVLGFLAISGLIFGVIILKFNSIILDSLIVKGPKIIIIILAIEMIVLPIVLVEVYFISMKEAIWEWIIFFSVLVWLIPLSMILLRQIHQELKCA